LLREVLPIHDVEVDSILKVPALIQRQEEVYNLAFTFGILDNSRVKYPNDISVFETSVCLYLSHSLLDTL
jgi:hypothetical protein